MANQTLTQLAQTTSASYGDVLYLVTDYQPGSPTLTGTSKQIYFSAFTGSITGATISTNTNDSIVTATGTVPSLNAEPNLKFDGSNLNVTGNTTGSGFGWVNTLQVGSATTGGTSTGLVSPIYVVATKTDATTYGLTTQTVSNWTNEYTTAGSSWQPSTGQFTSPRTTTYRVTAIMTFTGVSATTATADISVTVSVTGSTNNAGFTVSQTTNSYGRQIVTTATVPMVTNNTLTISLLNSGGVPIQLATSAGYNRLIIEEIGAIITD